MELTGLVPEVIVADILGIPLTDVFRWKNTLPRSLISPLYIIFHKHKLKLYIMLPILLACTYNIVATYHIDTFENECHIHMRIVNTPQHDEHVGIIGDNAAVSSLTPSSKMITPDIFPSGIHKWPDIALYGPPTTNVKDEKGRIVVLPWCHVVSEIPSTYAPHTTLCHIDSFEEHIASNAIVMQDYRKEYNRSIDLLDVIEHLKTGCITERLASFIMNPSMRVYQFAGSSEIVMLHVIQWHYKCLDLKRLYIPRDTLYSMDEWTFNSNQGEHCDMGDRFIDELYLNIIDPLTADFNILRFSNKRMYSTKPIDPPSLELRELYHFSPIMAYGEMWQRTSRIGSHIADRKSTRLNSSHVALARMPSSA